MVTRCNLLRFFGIQRYCDWIGAAARVQAAINFNVPYQARSCLISAAVHITLSEWLRTIVPVVGGLRKRRFNLYRNMMLTMRSPVFGMGRRGRLCCGAAGMAGLSVHALVGAAPSEF